MSMFRLDEHYILSDLGQNLLRNNKLKIRIGNRNGKGNGIYIGNWIFQAISNGKGNGNLEISVKVIPVFLLTLVCLFSDSRIRRKTGITVSTRSVTVIPVFLLTLES